MSLEFNEERVKLINKYMSIEFLNYKIYKGNILEEYFSKLLIILVIIVFFNFVIFI